MTTSVIAASNSRDQSVEFGVVGGVLAVGAILAISVASAIIVVFMMKKIKRMSFEKGYYSYVMHTIMLFPNYHLKINYINPCYTESHTKTVS